MNIKAAMRTDVRHCAPTDTLVTAARLMADGDFGFLPVIDARNHLVGVLTDRDVCLAIANELRAPATIPVNDIMTRKVHTCLVTDDAHVVIATMKKHHVRRVPMIGKNGRVEGLVSLDDLVLAFRDPEVAVSADDILEALKAVCTPHAAAPLA